MIFALSAVELALAFCLDCIIGDPRWIPHPVRLIGRAISALEAALRRTMGGGYTAGAVLMLIIAGGTFAITAWLTAYLRTLPGIWGSALLIILSSMTLALHDLLASVGRVIAVIDDLPSARRAVAMIVGRDTAQLDRDGVLRATLESLAENASDGIIAPLFYLAAGGLPAAMTYKAINTLDSMVGYKNERYMKFGFASAKLDDAANYIPARISAILIALGALAVIGPAAALDSIRTAIRDGRNHTSPNSGVPEAAVAGALGVRLGGASTYGGVLVDKPAIGDAACAITPSRVRLGGAVVAMAACIGLGIAVLLQR